MEVGEHTAAATDHKQGPYRKLDPEKNEFRTLLVKAGEHKDDIYCELQHVSFQNDMKPPYETISYVWGDPTTRGTVYLQGRKTDVPASSERVLRRFRHREADRILWIDAICINQADIQERGQQVAMMAEIYSSTSHGLIWLGEDHDDCANNAKKAIAAILDDAYKGTDGFRGLRKVLYDSRGVFQKASTSGPFDFDFSSVFSYFSSLWFQRLWVGMPVVKSTQNMCANDFGAGCSRSRLASFEHLLLWRRSVRPSSSCSSGGLAQIQVYVPPL